MNIKIGQSRSNGTPLSSLLLFILVSFFLSGCSKDSDDEPKVVNNLNITVITKSPSMPIDFLALSSEGNEENPQFTSYKSSTSPKYSVWAKQKGILYNFGVIEASAVSDKRDKARLELDLSEKLSSSEPYDLYTIGDAWHRIDNELFFKSKLSRGGSFGVYSKITNPDKEVEAVEKMTNTCEILFIINKSGQPIKFKHKGFDAEKKWYYSSAEVSMDDGHVGESTQGVEVVSGEVDIPVYNGKSATRFHSYYVPNGQKIQNAQLIAEINGKEVRSENRISSDLTLQLSNCYGMYVIWDGEKLTLGDESGEPVVIDMTDPEGSGIEVKSIENDGTMTIEAPEDKAPKVGDILCSGSTELAPYGYLYKVTEVNRVNSQSPTRMDGWDRLVFELKVIRTTLTAVIDNFHATFRFPINLDDVKVSNVITEEGVELTSSGDYQTIWQLPKKKLTFGNISLTPDIKIKPENLTLYLEIGGKQIKKFGADFDAEFEASVQIDANFKSTAVDKSYPLYDVFLDPITIMIGTVPVVITPYFMVYLSIKVDGSAQLSWVPVSCEYDVHLGGYFNTETNKFVPSEGREKFLTYENCKQTQETWLDLNSGFTVKGTVKSGLGVGLSLGLYGCNLVGKGNLPIKTNGDLINFDNLADLASLELYADLYDKMTAGISLDDINLKPGEESHFDDICKTSVEFVCGVAMHLGFTSPFTGERKGFDPSYETNPLVLLKEKEGQTLFWSGFAELNASLNGDNLHMTSNKLRPLFDIFEEKGFGFKYVKIKDGQIVGQWDMADVSSYYSHDVYKSLWDYTVEADIPISKFERGNTYYICPYTCFKWYDSSNQYYISRQGMYITISNNGKLTYNELGEIPGEDL